MEEILASIRKIISEDEDTRSPATPQSQAQLRTVEPEPEFDEVETVSSASDLDLGGDDSMFEEFDLSDITEEAEMAPVSEEAEEFSALEIAEEVEDAADTDVFEEMELPAEEEAFSDLPVEEEAFDLPELEIEPEPAPEPEIEIEAVEVEAAPVPPVDPDPVSPAEVKMQAALTEQSTDAAAAGALARLVAKMDMGSEHTLEGLVREMLKPMIKEWLDANLPAIVEDKVEAEVQRIARLAR